MLLFYFRDVYAVCTNTCIILKKEKNRAFQVGYQSKIQQQQTKILIRFFRYVFCWSSILYLVFVSFAVALPKANANVCSYDLSRMLWLYWTENVSTFALLLLVLRKTSIISSNNIVNTTWATMQNAPMGIKFPCAYFPGSSNNVFFFLKLLRTSCFRSQVLVHHWTNALINIQRVFYRLYILSFGISFTHLISRSNIQCKIYYTAFFRKKNKIKTSQPVAVIFIYFCLRAAVLLVFFLFDEDAHNMPHTTHWHE